jgi:hypothetical protein
MVEKATKNKNLQQEIIKEAHFIFYEMQYSIEIFEYWEPTNEYVIDRDMSLPREEVQEAIRIRGYW